MSSVRDVIFKLINDKTTMKCYTYKPLKGRYGNARGISYL